MMLSEINQGQVFKIIEPISSEFTKKEFEAALNLICKRGSTCFSGRRISCYPQTKEELPTSLQNWFYLERDSEIELIKN